MFRRVLVVATLALAVQVVAAAAGADGIMLVPAGAFWMGRDGGPAGEAPMHRVFVQDFWIERHKVTNAEFAEFLSALGAVAADKEVATTGTTTMPAFTR